MGRSWGKSSRRRETRDALPILQRYIGNYRDATFESPLPALPVDFLDDPSRPFGFHRPAAQAVFERCSADQQPFPVGPADGVLECLEPLDLGVRMFGDGNHVPAGLLGFDLTQ